MAHFALVNADNIVEDVLVVHNQVITDEDDVEQEELGQAFLASLGLAGTWLQCSYNNNFRGIYPGVGYGYDPVANVFTAPEVPDEAL